MTAESMLRIATPDAAHAVDIACSDVESAVGLPAHAEFQEIEGGNLIIELRLGVGAEQSPHPSRLASAVDKAVANVEVLSSWKDSSSPIRLLGNAPTCWGWDTTRCPTSPNVRSTTAFQPPSGIGPTRHGTWPCRPSAGAKR